MRPRRRRRAENRGARAHRLLEGRTVGLLFRKHSTRTRVSLEVACRAPRRDRDLSPGRQLQLARGESVGDTARVLSANSMRSRSEHTRTARWTSSLRPSAIPIVNALTDEAHPLQALADLQTIRERFGTLEGVRVAWVGDGNNVCLSLAKGCSLLDAELTCASPPGYEPAGLESVADPREAVRGAHVVVTDVWTSMGQEAERGERLAAFDAGRSTRGCSPRPIRRDRPRLPPATGRGDLCRRPLRGAKSSRPGRGGELPGHRQGWSWR